MTITSSSRRGWGKNCTDQPSKVQMPKQVVWEEGRGMGLKFPILLTHFFTKLFIGVFWKEGWGAELIVLGEGGCIRLTWTSILSSKSTEKRGKWRNPKDSETTFSYSSNDNQPLYRSNAKFVTLLGFSCWCMKSKEVTNKNFKPLLLWSQNICTHANKMKTFLASTSLDRYLKFIRKIIKNSLSSCFLFTSIITLTIIFLAQTLNQD